MAPRARRVDVRREHRDEQEREAQRGRRADGGQHEPHGPQQLQQPGDRDEQRGARQCRRDDRDQACPLRELARRAGVSHAAPAHHFGDRRGLFTALATEGYELLSAALGEAVDRRAFADAAIGYVAFALAHAGHYAVMFRPDLLDGADPALAAARLRSANLLEAGLDTVPAHRLRMPRDRARAAAWALVHGLASLRLGGMLPAEDMQELTRDAAWQLFGAGDDHEAPDPG
jgi:AcrR family transcriptional regulator